MSVQLPILKAIEVVVHPYHILRVVAVERRKSFRPFAVCKCIVSHLNKFVFQLLFPFRGHFLPNQLDWTTIGNRFSWRMKVDTRKSNEMQFYVHSPELNNPVQVDIQTFINDLQIKNMSMDPRSVADFAEFMRLEAVKYEAKDPSVTANIKIEYNGRPAQYFVKPDVDLSRVIYSPFKKADWIVPVN